MRYLSALAALAVAACAPSPVEQCDRFRDALCTRIDECGINPRATCLGLIEEGGLNCDDVTGVSDPAAADYCTEDVAAADCDDLAADPPELGAACADVEFYR